MTPPGPVPPRLTRLLDRASVLPYAGMTYPHYLVDLLTVAPAARVVAVGAEADRPCGLALARVDDGSGDAQLLSVLVRGEARRRGIGSALVAAVEVHLRERGVARIRGTYPSGKESTPAVERMLAKCGWDAPAPRLALFAVGPTIPPDIDRAAWFQPTVLPPGVALVGWADLADSHKAAVAAGVEAGEVPRFVSPFQEEATLDPRFCLALVAHGEIVGWGMTHRTSPSTIRLTALYADPRRTAPGVGTVLLGEILRRVVRVVADGEPLTLNWAIDTANPLYRVCTRRILKHIPGHTLTVTMGSGKQLG